MPPLFRRRSEFHNPTHMYARLLTVLVVPVLIAGCSLTLTLPSSMPEAIEKGNQMSEESAVSIMNDHLRLYSDQKASFSVTREAITCRIEVRGIEQSWNRNQIRGSEEHYNILAAIDTSRLDGSIDGDVATARIRVPFSEVSKVSFSRYNPTDAFIMGWHVLLLDSGGKRLMRLSYRTKGPSPHPSPEFIQFMSALYRLCPNIR